jgi:hypothetical protein
MIIPITALEWHLAWAALSGMETSFFTFLAVLYLWLDDRGTSPFYLGAVGALAAAVRPEGLVLSALYVLKLGVTLRRSPRQFFHSAIQYALSLTILLAPLALFNLRYGSSPIPNTGLAKYMAWTYPWTVGKMTTFLVDVAAFFVLGPLMLLCPLVPIPVIRAWKDRSLRLFMPSLWIVGLIMLYAFTLPALYHNGRYLMPLIPVVIILGLDGLQTLSSQFRSISRFWNVYRVAVLAMILVTWLSNARSYSLESHLLEHSHLRIANWIQMNTAPNAVIATHDIGILGYYGGRRIVDLAGLVTPDVIPLFHEPHSLAEYGRRNHVGYVVVFTDFYLDLLHDLNAQLVFSPDPDTVQQGLVPFEVFAVHD